MATKLTGRCGDTRVEMAKFRQPRLVMKGAGLKADQELLGHADLKMTRRYANLSPEHLRDSVNLLYWFAPG